MAGTKLGDVGLEAEADDRSKAMQVYCEIERVPQWKRGLPINSFQERVQFKTGLGTWRCLQFKVGAGTAGLHLALQRDVFGLWGGCWRTNGVDPGP